MSEYERKYAAAIKELEATEIKRIDYLPPPHRQYRKLGLNVRPPHYVGNMRNVTSYAIFFVVFTGFTIWIFRWITSDTTGGSIFGFNVILPVMLLSTLGPIRIADGRRKWKLTAWDDL